MTTRHKELQQGFQLLEITSLKFQNLNQEFVIPNFSNEETDSKTFKSMTLLELCLNSNNCLSKLLNSNV